MVLFTSLLRLFLRDTELVSWFSLPILHIVCSPFLSEFCFQHMIQKDSAGSTSSSLVDKFGDKTIGSVSHNCFGSEDKVNVKGYFV